MSGVNSGDGYDVMTQLDAWIRLDGGDVTLVMSVAVGQPPGVLYWGARLPADVTAQQLSRLSARDSVHGTEQTSITLSLALEPGLGLPGPCGLQVHRQGLAWAGLLVVHSWEKNQQGLCISCVDERAALTLTYDLTLQADSGVLSVASTLTNDGTQTLDVNQISTACLPVSQRMTDILSFTGRWAGEFQTERVSRFVGAYVRENRRGRSSADCFPGLFLGENHTGETQGLAYGFHLAWSGNHHARVETLRDGRLVVMMGSLVYPGEVRLAPGESFVNPTLIAAFSQQGWSGVSRKLHHYVRHQLLRPKILERPRPVHINVWEAVYFNHDMDTLRRLAEQAAAIGVERFVLDDGWFGARRSDRAGLGDWYVSTDVYPDGLRPLIDHVRALGMEMGIWFEPEMVNPDSDLYRAHPDWVLQVDGLAPIPFRHQLVLDISRAEVADYLYERISSMLSEFDIGYIKWDMNRDLNHPGDFAGQPRAHAQVGALWALIDRLREAFPEVEIETCSSGGARADYGMLRYTDRVWTSDNNDAVERQLIQRGASYFLPLNVLGAHVGARTSHQTARKLPIHMRAATALMGHMGLELNLLQVSQHEREVLQAAIVLYKELRAHLHSGDLVRLDSPDHAVGFGVVSADARQAVYSYAYLDSQPRTHEDRLYFSGLSDQFSYRLRLRWPLNWQSPLSEQTPAWQALDLQDGAVFHGAALLHNGLQLPTAMPHTVLIFHLETMT